ncbi:helix-turn-helix transcriptional regulator [Actinomadura xylanilytica]|uniref:helix-turn-helix transcriptional regulator n=1 Tax=Actinomadura xylanilytica TaxID=887459 RepID=UPI00255AE6AD|nr:response regulator transcription factor [Actinomadura xylanilytica]MDL4774204.1 response regulator transcription factor [Actinomadura xylanilytica]
MEQFKHSDIHTFPTEIAEVDHLVDNTDVEKATSVLPVGSLAYVMISVRECKSTGVPKMSMSSSGPTGIEGPMGIEGRVGIKDLKVALDVGNEVLARGLRDALGQITGIGDVRRCDGGSQAGPPLHAEGADVLITTSARAAWLRDIPHPAGGHCPKALVLLDETEVGRSSAATLPADGFLIQQDLTVDALGDALARMVKGEIPMPARLTRDLLARADSPVHAELPRLVRLTAREKETLTLLAEGLSNKQIARRLAISDHGVKRLVTSVLLKLGAPNRTAAVVTAIRVGLIDHLRESQMA